MLQPVSTPSTYAGFVDLQRENGAAPAGTVPVEPPELNEGPHFYGLQWWFFGVLAVAGFFYVLYDEWRTVASNGSAGSGRQAERARTAPAGGGDQSGKRRSRKELAALRNARRAAVRAAYQQAYAAERAARSGR